MANGTANEVIVVFKQEVKGTNQVKKASDNVKEFGKEAEKTGGEIKNSGFSFQGFGKTLSSTFPKITTFIRLFKKIALLKFVRTIIAEITKGFREGVNAVYQYSKEMQNFSGSFAQRMDELATARNYLQNSIGAAVSPLISILAEAISKTGGLIDKFVDLLNIVNQVFARLNGQNYWTKAKKVPMEYAEATKKATKENEKLKKSLLGFDEINKLDDPTSKSSSTSGSGTDYSIQFETVQMSQEQMKQLDLLLTRLKNIAWIVGTIIASIKTFQLLKKLGLLNGVSGLKGTLSVVTKIIGVLATLKGTYDIITGAIEFFNGDEGLKGTKKMMLGILEVATGLGIIFGSTGWGLVLGAVLATTIMILTHLDECKEAMESWFTKSGTYTEDWKRGMKQIFKDIGIDGDKLVDDFVSAWHIGLNDIRNAFIRFKNWIWEKISAIGNWFSNIFDKIGKLMGGNNYQFRQATMDYSYGMYADGGFPTQGQLFWANENGAGAELVGQIGGRTAVANTNEITQGIASGVASAQAPQIALLSEQNKLLRALLDKESTTKVSVTDIVNGMQRKNRRDGITTIAVGG